MTGAQQQLTPPTQEELAARSRTQNAMASRLLLLRLQRHHYEYAPKSHKDKCLPVLHRDAIITRLPRLAAKKTLSQKKALITPVSRLNFDHIEIKAATPLRTILVVVAYYYRTEQAAILGKSRIKELVLPRHICCYLASHLSDASISRIGKFFRRDHTVVLHARKVITRKMLADPTLCLQIETIRKQIEALGYMPDVDHVARLRAKASAQHYTHFGRVP